MTDLLHVLPDFPTSSYTHLLPSLEKNLITTSDLLTLDALDVAKRAQLPILDIRRFVGHINEALQEDLGIAPRDKAPNSDWHTSTTDESPRRLGSALHELRECGQISLLDHSLDAALHGGIRSGYVTEITGESGAGKTQFLLSLLLAAQLPSPHGLGRSSIYVSTEAPLATTRLAQILRTHPALSNLSDDDRPTFENVRAIPVGDLETQDHILEYQLPAALERFNAGLVVLDSVAANYRAEHGSSVPRDLADRASRLAKLGHQLRTLAVKYNIAVVVANQVSDRLESAILRTSQPQKPASSFHSSPPTVSSSPAIPLTETVIEDADLSLDHQQRFFTGWGDQAPWITSGLKTPALGLAWSNQISCRIALKMGRHENWDPHLTVGPNNEMFGGNLFTNRKARRYMKVVFAPWAPGHDHIEGVRYEITESGIRAAKDEKEAAGSER